MANQNEKQIPPFQTNSYFPLQTQPQTKTKNKYQHFKTQQNSIQPQILTQHSKTTAEVQAPSSVRFLQPLKFCFW